MTLHTLNKQASDLLRVCISALAPGDSLLLYEDGVYAALANEANGQHLATLPKDVKLYALIEDLQARGISDRVPEVVVRITYREFVSLSLTCNKVVNWN